jgi:ABC-type sulfate/molybdate transport systems ATPase subunit
LRAGERTLVDELSLELGAGEHLVLVGPNGSGKSTLLQALAGLSAPDGGTIRRPDDAPGMLFQDGALWPHMSVARHLEFVDTRDDRPWRERLLDTLHLSSLADARPEALSGGERVRLALARALASRPAWLLLDEPLAHLDANFGDLLREALPALVEEVGASTIVVTHEADHVQLFGERVLCLSGEGAWWLGSAQEALTTPPTPVLAAISGRGTVLSGHAGGDGRVDYGHGLVLDGQTPGALVTAFLDASDVGFGDDGASTAEGCFVAPDRRGGCWVRVGERLLRCGDAPDAREPGATVTLSVRGALRVLRPGGEGASAGMGS